MTNEVRLKAWAEAARRDGDDEAAAAIEALLKERDDERQWRERATYAVGTLRSELDQERRTVAEVRRERDAADKRALEMCAVQEAEMQARCRAEADNAALLAEWPEVLCGCTMDANGARGALLPDPHCPTCDGTGRIGPPEGAHPGAALLEELRTRGQREDESVAAIAATGVRTEYGLSHAVDSLLEYVRALEAVRETAIEALGTMALPFTPACEQTCTGPRERLMSALRAADALKVKP